MIMREVKHITSNTPQDKGNYNPIWSKDGKYIVYTQEQAKGTDSNIFIADLGTGQSTLLTPHDGEQIFSANDVSPDGKSVLLTSNASNGYENIGILSLATKKITGSPKTNGKSAPTTSPPTANIWSSAPTWTAMKTSTCTTSAPENQPSLPIAGWRQRAHRRPLRLQSGRLPPALHPQRPNGAERPLDLRSREK